LLPLPILIAALSMVSVFCVSNSAFDPVRLIVAPPTPPVKPSLMVSDAEDPLMSSVP
jgi:hypothetical protein